jgi:hypothetical protein
MNWIGEIWRRVRMLARRGKFASELDEEMRLHREMKSESWPSAALRLTRRGMRRRVRLGMR